MTERFTRDRIIDLLRELPDVRFERGIPVFPRRPGAPTLTIEDVDRLADGIGE